MDLKTFISELLDKAGVGSLEVVIRDAADPEIIDDVASVVPGEDDDGDTRLIVVLESDDDEAIVSD